MNNTNFPQIVFLCLAFAWCNTTYTQDTKEAVILYNSQPVKAEITTDGNVNQIISEEPDFLKGFTLKVQDYGQFVEAQPNLFEKEKVLLNSQSYTIQSKEVASIRFTPSFATLSDEAISSLDGIIAILRTEPNTKINLETIARLDDGIVSKNRFNTIKTYLKLKGIDSDRISFDTLIGDKEVHDVKIYFLR